MAKEVGSILLCRPAFPPVQKPPSPGVVPTEAAVIIAKVAEGRRLVADIVASLSRQCLAK